ncbi:MAG: glycosyltransferase family 2 protein [Pirellulaceae bacterium]
MPKLAAVIPYQQGPSHLEATILSILENRNSQIELIVVDAGQYTDPYGLSGVEMTILPVDPNTDWFSMVYEGIQSSIAPIVQVIAPGMTVTKDWWHGPLEAFTSAQIGAVQPAYHAPGGPRIAAGLDRTALPRRSLKQQVRDGEAVGVSSMGGFFRKRALLALDGWLKGLPRDAADAEMTLALTALDFQTLACPESKLIIDQPARIASQPSYATGMASGQIAAAYAQNPKAEVTVDSLAGPLGQLASALVHPSTVAERLGWVLGQRDQSLVRRITRRLREANERLEPWRQSVQALGSDTQRRVA